MDGEKSVKFLPGLDLTFPKSMSLPRPGPLQGRGRDSCPSRFSEAAGRPGLCIPARSEGR